MPVFPYDSFFFGWMNIFPSIKRALESQEMRRSPYPPIVEDPNYFDIINNLNWSDYGTFFVYNLITIPLFAAQAIWKIKIDKINPSETYMAYKHFNRMNFFQGISFGLLFMVVNCQNRIMGMTWNGLNWKYAEFDEI